MPHYTFQSSRVRRNVMGMRLLICPLLYHSTPCFCALFINCMKTWAPFFPVELHENMGVPEPPQPMGEKRRGRDGISFQKFVPKKVRLWLIHMVPQERN